VILTLEVTGSEAGKLGAGCRKVFHASGGNIGRLPDSNWILPDSLVSGRHALITYLDGAFYIEDTSTNGVFINSPDNRLVRGQPYGLKSGDRIFIDPYEIRASIASESKVSAVPPFGNPFDEQPVAFSFGTSESRSTGEAMPVEEDDWFNQLGGSRPKPAAGGSAPNAADLAGKSVLSDHYHPPSVPVAPEPVFPSPDALIPSDYDPLGADDRPATFRSQAPPAPPRPAPANPSVASRAKAQSPSAPPAEELRSRMSGDTDLAAVLAGAGLGDITVTPELARGFGQILRVVVAGVMDVLQVRQRTKDEFRMGMTAFKPEGNNPLKFSANVDDALHNLLVKRNAAYLGPVDAFEDAFDDLRNHQMAMLAGVRLAFEAMLAEFDPDHLQARFDRQLKRGALLSVPAKLRYWDLYRDWIHDMVQDADTSFRDLFGDEFARAYEEQLKRLKTQSGAGER